MPNCPYCDVPIDEAYNFCVSCEQQVKCLKCGSYLLKNKSKCLNCGTLLNTSQPNVAPTNTFSLEEERSDSNYSRKLNLSFTDTAIDKVSSVLGNYVPLTPSINQRHVSTHAQKPILPPFQEIVEEERLMENETLQEQAIDTTVQNGNARKDSLIPLNYFEKDGEGFLISTTPDYKGRNKKSQQKHFILLYVWAYNLTREEPVPNKEHLIQAARLNEIYDTNFSTNFNEIASRFPIEADGTFKLNPNGHAETNKILLEMQNSEKSGFEYWNSNRRTSTRSSKPSKEEEQQIENWLQQPSNFDNFDVRTLSTVVNFVILALCDITKELKVQEAVKPATAYEYLIRRYKTVPVTKKNFRDNIANKRYEKYFRRTSDGLYYLTPEAENLAQSWIN